MQSLRLFLFWHVGTKETPVQAQWRKPEMQHLPIFLSRSKWSHMKKHRDDKQEKCDHCEFASSHKNSLKVHLRIHNGEKLYKCNHCDYKAVFASALTRHKKTHAGQKNHIWNQCGFACSVKSDLGKHMRIHGEKSQKCDQCSCTTYVASNLKSHVKKHIPSKDYRCSVCDFATSYAQALQFHIETSSVLIVTLQSTWWWKELSL